MISLSIRAGGMNVARTRAMRRRLRRAAGAANEQPIKVTFERADGTAVEHVYRPGGRSVPRI